MPLSLRGRGPTVSEQLPGLGKESFRLPAEPLPIGPLPSLEANTYRQPLKTGIYNVHPDSFALVCCNFLV